MSCSNGIRIIVWIYLLNMKGIVVHGQVAGPNAVAIINGQTMLDCITIDPTLSNWRRTTDGSNNAVTIATGCNVVGNNAAYYRTEQPGGNICRLIIANVTMQLGGVYACNDGGSKVYQSLVTVIDPYASVDVYNGSVVVVGDQLNISCSINYTGPQWPAPSLHPSPYWTTSPGQIYTSDTYNTSTTVVTLVATVTVQKYTVPIFRCKTVFEITGNTNTYNPVPPADNFTVGNTTELDVQYPPDNISINSTVSTKDNCVSIPANLICTADAKPPAQYNWVDIINNITTPGAVKSITSGGQYQCIASNNIRGQIYNDTKTVNETSCHQVNNLTISGSNCENNSCTCTANQSLVITCMAYGTPNPYYKWSADFTGYKDFGNGTMETKINGNYRCRSTNEYGGNTYNATGTIGVSDCRDAETTTGSNPVATTTPPSSNTTTENPGGGKKGGGLKTGEKVGIAFGCLGALNVVATCLFPVYYNKDKGSHSGTNERSGNIKTKSNKLRLNRRFPWLKKMLPCLNDTKEDVGSNCLWLSLYILLGTFTGIVTFPILILLSKKSEKNIETSSLNQRENGAANESTANGIITVNYPRPPSPPDDQTKAGRREDPYQNESSRENIELNNSLHSRGRLMDSPTSSTSPKGKPPTPPNKPTVNTPGRGQNYVVTEPATVNQNNPTYAELPIKLDDTPTIPVQFLDMPEDAYAPLKKT